MSIRELMRFRERRCWYRVWFFLDVSLRTYLCSATRVRSYRASHSTARARYPGRCRRPRPSRSCAAPRASCSCATRAAAGYTSRRRASTDIRRRAPRPTARPRTSPGPKARTNTTRASSSTRRVRASRRSHRPPISHRERPERRTRLAPPATTSSTAHTLPLFFTLHHQSRLPRHRSGLPQGETRPKRGRGGQVHARHVRGPAVPRRLTPAPQGGRARLRLPPAPRLPSPRSRPVRAGVHRNVRIGPTATLGHPRVPRPARPGRTHVRRVRRRTIEETLRQLLTTQYPELTPTLEPKT